MGRGWGYGGGGSMALSGCFDSDEESEDELEMQEENPVVAKTKGAEVPVPAPLQPKPGSKNNLTQLPATSSVNGVAAQIGQVQIVEHAQPAMQAIPAPQAYVPQPVQVQQQVPVQMPGHVQYIPAAPLAGNVMQYVATAPPQTPIQYVPAVAPQQVQYIPQQPQQRPSAIPSHITTEDRIVSISHSNSLSDGNLHLHQTAPSPTTPDHLLPTHLIAKSGEPGAVFGSMGSSLSLSLMLGSKEALHETPHNSVGSAPPSTRQSSHGLVTRETSVKSSSSSKKTVVDSNSNVVVYPDHTPVSSILARVAFEHNWSPEELDGDLEALNKHRIRTAKDVRKLTKVVWAEIVDVLPVTKDLLRQAVGWVDLSEAQ
ncbi:hypothetical protein HDV05_004110 [Chytridiales sp. JEL 0842]|nr:hypothetical protein HDV05_004110 [Chytridiales sp. JEL 0842]